MNNAPESPIVYTNNHSPSEERKQSPPAFLDLADSSARLGSNMPELTARVELKRMEHERQRAIQRQLFEDQMRALEQQQAHELLDIPYTGNGSPINGSSGIQHLAVSAPTTPPRLSATLPNEHLSIRSQFLNSDGVSSSEKRKSVTYAPSVNLSPDVVANGNSQPFSRAAGAKSMPASRRTSASEHDEELSAHLHGLSLAGEMSNRASPIPGAISTSILNRGSRYGVDEGAHFASTYNAGLMLDEQLDQEMNNAMRHLPTSDDDKYNSFGKVSTSSAALDLAHISQTSPRNTFGNKALDSRNGSSEWPQYPTGPRAGEVANRRIVTNPAEQHALNKLNGISSASNTPLIPSQAQASSLSRRASPPGLLDGLTNGITRSVPATPLGISPSASQLLKTAGTPGLNDSVNGRLSAQPHDGSLNVGDLHASLSRLPQGQYENGGLGYSPVQPNVDEYGVDYGMNGNLDGSYNSYGFDAGARAGGNTSGSTALYHHNGTRYGLGIPGRTASGGPDSKMNGLHGPKHKRGDIDREFNRFAGTRLEDLQGEIPALCKDQHGCRYLQKKLEEGLPEHRDMIFRETFGHFADLMTDPFGNYLCQKLLEYSTDEQRNLICESVAQDLVNISLNMHGTRAVQKMIDFLSTRRQADLRYNAQIHSIIVALSLHVVVLIKDLNGNHVIQKCLNKLTPEDNQFIYNAVAANCVEVATHRHGCCVLQRCVDHASDHQRIQLVNEITFNALTLVQDPYGNYVVQYILDLNDNRFSDAVIRQFAGNVCALSVQKFSSNVIEKCVRVAEHSTRKMLIEELLNRTRLEKLLRDSYGNYCVQTALDYAEPTQRALLVEGIRPVLPLIRNTPYGKRIQNKLQREQMDHFGGGYAGQHGLVNMALTNQALGSARLPQAIPGSPLTDLYASQPGGLYSMPPQNQASYGQSHLSSLHGLQTQSIDPYVLQNGSGHGQGLSPGGFGGGFSPSLNQFNSGITTSISDPYSRSGFGGYGM